MGKCGMKKGQRKIRKKRNEGEIREFWFESKRYSFIFILCVQFHIVLQILPILKAFHPF